MRSLMILAALAAWKEKNEGPSDTGMTEPVVAECQSSASPELFLGRGVGGAFVPLEDGQELGLSSAPQGGFGVRPGEQIVDGLQYIDDNRQPLTTWHHEGTGPDQVNP